MILNQYLSDINKNGEFNILDVVAFQKWLLVDPDSNFYW